jgi:hypothetical protein
MEERALGAVTSLQEIGQFLTRFREQEMMDLAGGYQFRPSDYSRNRKTQTWLSTADGNRRNILAGTGPHPPPHGDND